MGTHESKQKTSEPRLWSLPPHSDMRTSCLLSLCSYFGPQCQLYMYSFSFSPPQALSCPVLLSDRGPLPKINCHALVANRFWEAERESLSKQRLHLGVDQCTEIPFWPVHPNCGSRMHFTQREAYNNVWYNINTKHCTPKLLFHFTPTTTFSL